MCLFCSIFCIQVWYWPTVCNLSVICQFTVDLQLTDILLGLGALLDKEHASQQKGNSLAKAVLSVNEER